MRPLSHRNSPRKRLTPPNIHRIEVLLQIRHPVNLWTWDLAARNWTMAFRNSRAKSGWPKRTESPCHQEVAPHRIATIESRCPIPPLNMSTHLEFSPLITGHEHYTSTCAAALDVGPATTPMHFARHSQSTQTPHTTAQHVQHMTRTTGHTDARRNNTPTANQRTVGLRPTVAGRYKPLGPCHSRSMAANPHGRPLLATNCGTFAGRPAHPVATVAPHLAHTTAVDRPPFARCWKTVAAKAVRSRLTTTQRHTGASPLGC